MCVVKLQDEQDDQHSFSTQSALFLVVGLPANIAEDRMSIFGNIRERLQLHVLSTLRSDEGRKAIVSVIETKEGRAAILAAFARKVVEAEVHQIFERLRDELRAEAMKAVDENRSLFEDIMRSEKRRNIDALTDEANKLSVSCIEGLQKRATKVYESLDSGLTRTVNERLQEFGKTLVSEAVATYVRSRPVTYPGWSNRNIAADQGISIREVKRRRRADLL
jgi:hypothetical protein